MFNGLRAGATVVTSTILALVVFVAGGARADDSDVRELRERMQKLESQNEELRHRLDSAPATWPTQPTNGIQPAGLEEEQQKGGELKLPAEKKAPEASAWLDVGKKLDMHMKWDNYYPWFSTDDGAFRIHVGGRLQTDFVWARTTDAVQTGVGGIGNMSDGVNFRRSRLTVDGWMYEVFDFWCEYDFINPVNVDPLFPATEATVSNQPVPTDCYGSVNFLPILGTVRAGNMKPPISLEHLASSRWLDFMERSGIFDAYLNRSNGFQPGIQIANWTENERLTWQAGMFKNNQNIVGWNVSDGDYQFNARVTGLPIYRDEGRCMVHLGCGVQYDAPDNGVALLRERWLLRQGPFLLQNVVAQALVRGEDQFFVQPELFVNMGPFSLQAEYITNWMDNVTGFVTQSQGAVASPTAMRSYFSHGGYVQAMYFLTGEHRPYGRTALHGSGAAPTRVVPHRNFYWLPGQGCPNPFSCGAWQVGARWNYTDFSNHGVFGGQINEVTLGLNWFLNPNAKLQWNYDIGYRGQLGPGSSSSGTYQGLGTRLAFDF